MTRQNAAQSQNRQLNSDVTPKNNSKENEQENRDLNNNEEHKPSLMQRGVKSKTKTVAKVPPSVTKACEEALVTHITLHVLIYSQLTHLFNSVCF